VSKQILTNIEPNVDIKSKLEIELIEESNAEPTVDQTESQPKKQFNSFKLPLRIRRF
jgi:hypothetical protein